MRSSQLLLLLQQMLLLLLLSALLVYPPPFSVRGQLIEATGNGSSQQLVLFPSQGDLLLGRVPHLTASSTCGEESPKVYCPIGQTKCITCDSKHEWDKDLNPNSHKIGNVVAKIRNSNTTYDSWWMSEPGTENVTIQLDLDAKFTFTHLIMIFHSYRPKAWWLERSSDYGETYKPYGYFAEKCEEAFPWVDSGPRMQVDDVVCSSSYTDMTPSDRGQVVFNAVPQHISETEIPRERREAQTDITNLRIHLVKYHTLSDEKLSSDSSELSKYYFGLYEVNVHGMCICNGHALTCKPAEGVAVVDRNAVYGHCECMHNTQGPNCEECLEFYHDRKWAPATLTSSNECRRCQCHGHSDKCAFSQKKWEETGGMSGGVCLDCMHNTTGDNCQRCAQGQYRDEAKSLEDPDICTPCECSEAGIREAFCEPETDKAKGLIAGHCHCKANVAGRNCDRCKPGYWDLRKDNPDGCQVCDCLLLGTSGNQGCNQYTGQCPCKANVEGEKCNRCKAGYFNLNQIDTGCSSCDCDVGGSTSHVCHPVSGECLCKPGFGGRKCDVIQDRFYVPHFDIDGVSVDAGGSPDSARFPRVTKLEEPTLTGRSGLRLKTPAQRTPDELVIPLLNHTTGLPPGEYDIALKVYPKRVNISLELPVQLHAGASYLNCTARPSLLQRILQVPTTAEFRAEVADSRRPYLVKLVFAKICIDALGLDKIRIQLLKVSATDDVIIDAVVIGKNLDDPITYLLNKKVSSGRSVLPPFKMDVNATMSTSLYNCLDYWKPMQQQTSRMPEECRRLIQGLSGRSLPGALPCKCDGYGSSGPTCDKIGGQCSCLPNVVGRNCSSCAAMHYGFAQFSNDGCRPCGCSPTGSIGDQCDVISGQCPCLHPNIDGRQCDSCKTGYWSFPICIDCVCNGLAADCHKATGVCLNCGNNTAGNECQDCKTGYFGDPRRSIACQPCRCPGGSHGTVQHAVTCQLKSDSPPTAKCNCQPGYLGDSCERCDVNNYGDPTTGDCTRCSCNGNINFSVPNSCDPDTGRCVKCLNQTTGASCEECKSGFHGQAAVGRCQACACSPEGTVPDALLRNPILYGNQFINYTCNSKTGQCSCLPNVEGPHCNTCKPQFYNLTSRAGCTACNCDPIGSGDGQCDVDTGQCPCRQGRGGRRCDQCQDLHFGDPTKPGLDGCQPCDCHPDGSQTNRCDKVTGRCVCKAAITGRRCDQCERGTTGVLPNCTTCGECWYNWDKLIAGLNSTATALRDRASRTAERGDFSGELGDQVNKFDGTLDQIWKGINETQIPGQLAVDVQKKLASLTQDFRTTKNIVQREANVARDLSGIKGVDLTGMTALVDRLNQAHLKPKREIEQTWSSLANQSLRTPADSLRLMRGSEAKFDAAAIQLGVVNSTVVQEETVSGVNGPRHASITARADELKATGQNKSDSALNIYRSVEKLLPELNKEMCVGYDEDKSFYSRAKNYCSDVCGGPSPDVCNSTVTSVGLCADSLVCANSVVARMRAVEANAASLGGRIAAAAKAAENDTKSVRSLNETSVKADNRAYDASAQVDALKSDYENLRTRAAQLSAEIDRFLESNQTTLADVTDLAGRIQSASLDFSGTKTADLSDRLKSLLKNVREAHNVTKIVEDTKEAKTTVQELLRLASKVTADAHLLKSAADNLTQLLSGVERSLLSAVVLLNLAQTALDSVANSVGQMSKAIDMYSSQLAAGRAKVESVRASLLKSQASQLRERITGLDREQNDTRLMLATAERSLGATVLRATNSGAGLSNGDLLKRQQALDNLRQRIGRLSASFGGDRVRLAKLETSIQTLEVSLEEATRRLGALLEKLKRNEDDSGSLVHMLDNVMNNFCRNTNP